MNSTQHIGNRAVSMRLVLAGVVLVVLTVNTTRADIVPITFSHIHSTNLFEDDLSGSASITGTGKATHTLTIFGKTITTNANFVFDNPTNHTLVSNHIATVRIPTGTANFDLAADSPGPGIQNIQNLSVDFKPSGVIIFDILNDTLLLSGDAQLPSYKLDYGGTISNLSFTQTGSATLTGSGGSGTYAVDGQVNLSVGTLKLTIGPFAVNLGSFSQAIPYTLTGAWSTLGSVAYSEGSLDGIMSTSIPLNFSFNGVLTTPGVSQTITVAVSLLSTLSLADTYHLVLARARAWDDRSVLDRHRGGPAGVLSPPAQAAVVAENAPYRRRPYRSTALQPQRSEFLAARLPV